MGDTCKDRTHLDIALFEYIVEIRLYLNALRDNCIGQGLLHPRSIISQGLYIYICP